MIRFRDFFRLREFKIFFIALGGVLALGLFAALVINIYVVSSTKGRIYSVDSVEEMFASDSVQDVASAEYDCILVLGCSVRPVMRDGERVIIPSDMLEDRLRAALAAYNAGAAPKILVSGDHGQADYDEVNTMKNFLIDNGVPSEDIFMDHAGFCTYDSVYRAKALFGVKKMLISTQSYHLNRAIFLADSFGIEVAGVSADLRTYQGQTMRDLREIAGRCKDFLTSIFKPDPQYLGQTYDIKGNGDVTNDK